MSFAIAFGYSPSTVGQIAVGSGSRSYHGPISQSGLSRFMLPNNEQGVFVACPVGARSSAARRVARFSRLWR